MRFNFYDKSFYILYCIYKRKFGKKELPVLTSVIVLAATTLCQIVFILLLSFELLGNDHAYVEILNRNIVIFCIILFLTGFHILYFYQRRRYYYIILKLRNSGDKYYKFLCTYLFINLFIFIGIILFVFKKE